MLGNFIFLYEYVKELVEYVNGSVDQPENKISAILDAEDRLSTIRIEHDYLKSDSVDGNNNDDPAVEVEYNRPSGHTYNLRKTKKIKEEESYIYYK